MNMIFSVMGLLGGVLCAVGGACLDYGDMRLHRRYRRFFRSLRAETVRAAEFRRVYDSLYDDAEDKSQAVQRSARHRNAVFGLGNDGTYRNSQFDVRERQ